MERVHLDTREVLAATLFHCRQCSKAYKRPEHLQRHYATHGSERPYQCQICGSTFQRSDVFKRHVKTCNGKQLKGSSITRRACDACAKSKRACNSVQPCRHCYRKGTICTFSGGSAPPAKAKTQQGESFPGTSGLVETYEPNEADIPVYGDLLSADNLAAISPNALYEYLGVNPFDFTDDELGWMTSKRSLSFDFLDSFTRNTGFISSFDCGTDSQRLLVYSNCQSLLQAERLQDDPLSLKSQEIVALVEEVVSVNPRNSPVTLSWSSELETRCLEFFCPQNIRLYLELYWSIWHPNVNYMHRPSFDPTQAKAVLVATMCIIGACVSPDNLDCDTSKSWFNCVEEMVFRDDDLCCDEHDSRSFPSDARLQSLQAAYMVCLFQNWEADDPSKRRIRRFRYSTVVAVRLPLTLPNTCIDTWKVARDIGIGHACHPRYDLQPALFSWHDFLAREQLIR